MFENPAKSLTLQLLNFRAQNHRSILGAKIQIFDTRICQFWHENSNVRQFWRIFIHCLKSKVKYSDETKRR